MRTGKRTPAEAHHRRTAEPGDHHARTGNPTTAHPQDRDPGDPPGGAGGRSPPDKNAPAQTANGTAPRGALAEARQSRRTRRDPRGTAGARGRILAAYSPPRPPRRTPGAGFPRRVPACTHAGSAGSAQAEHAQAPAYPREGGEGQAAVGGRVFCARPPRSPTPDAATRARCGREADAARRGRRHVFAAVPRGAAVAVSASARTRAQSVRYCAPSRTRAYSRGRARCVLAGLCSYFARGSFARVSERSDIPRWRTRQRFLRAGLRGGGLAWRVEGRQAKARRGGCVLFARPAKPAPAAVRAARLSTAPRARLGEGGGPRPSGRVPMLTPDRLPRRLW